MPLGSVHVLWSCATGMEHWGVRLSLLGIYGQREEDAAYRGPDKGPGHEPQAPRCSVTEQPGLSVQCKERPCPPPQLWQPIPSSVSSLPT